MKFRPLLLAAAATLLTTAAHADYQFSGAIDAGPQTGQAFTGSFDYDASGLTSSGFESLSLTAFSLDFLAMHFSLNAAATADFQDGVFLGLSYATSGAGFDLSMASGSMDTTDAYLFYNPVNGNLSSGGYVVTQAAPLPEPASLALTLGALGGAGWFSRRRKAA
ncbi:PEP-CTERM sorting domain-containing protein [Roseateles sp. NT4]|uniref:PEP-CTERM sorting domain-containing protein n=1 Tax=Roseateles sp. NT4 TaxID=3453715 RepID=UPI003EEAA060